MAVYQDARVRGAAFPPARVDDVRSPGARPALATSSQRVRPTGLLMAAIVAATMLALVYLTQTLGSHATTSEIAKLEGQRAKLQTQITQGSLLVIEASEPDEVRARANKLKLKKLGAPLVLRAP